MLIYDHQKVVSATSLRTRRAVQKYTTKYDNIDIDRIVASRRLLLNYVNCLLDKGPCTPEGKELKSKLALLYKYCKYSKTIHCSRQQSIATFTFKDGKGKGKF